MGRPAVDFQGIVNLDHKLTEQLERFLQEKESRLAHRMVHAIEESVESSTPLLPVGAYLKLSEAVEGIGKRVRLAASNRLHPPNPEENGDRALKEINAAFWEFTEVLQGCATELFQQVQRVPLDRWRLSVPDVIRAVTESLMHRIEDIVWAIRRLETPLKEYEVSRSRQKRKWFDWRGLKRSPLDPRLLKNLHETEKCLRGEYDAFQRRYGEFVQLDAQAGEYVKKIKSLPVLPLLDADEQGLYVEAFRLLKILELNRQLGKGLAIETARSLKYLSGPGRLSKVFQVYLRGLRKAFFEESLAWKSFNREQEGFKEVLEGLQEKTKTYREELHQLIQTMSRYRLFLLRNDPNPYIRSRWGFAEWIVGPEPQKAKNLLHLIYSAQALEAHFMQFLDALSRDSLIREGAERRAHQEIDSLLHEMGQPLISRAVMRNRAERFLDQLTACDEIGSSSSSTIDYVGKVLAKAMREDWKYHVLHEFPSFHQHYLLHQGLAQPVEDPAHAFRLDRFAHLFDQIEAWIKRGDAHAHIHEIELDINDMKTYLQDFLASIQRAAKQKAQGLCPDKSLQKFCQQLLEYRYVFGKFFLSLMAKGKGEALLRNQFVFVDQYFESIEYALEELE